jgi:hypothetical protein
LETIATKEIALAALGGASGIAGLLLVFVGFVIVKVEALPAETSDEVIDRYELVAKVGIAPLIVLVAVILASYLWLFYPTSSLLFNVWSIGFVVGMILFVLYSIWAVVLI